MTTIKITELANIGSDLASSTVVPVVNMAGTPVTQKTNIGNIANIVLQGAGVDYAEATIALLAQTVSNAAQPNITSVGILSSLEVTNDITASGTSYLGNISTTGVASITTLVVGTTADLGSVNNIIIEGGTDGQVLSTDGDGNLSWTTVSGGGNGVPGGSDTQVQYNDAGDFGGDADFTYDAGNNILNVIRANVSYLTAYNSIIGDSLTVEQDVSGNGALRLQGIAGGNSTINIGGEADIDVVANVGNINLYTANNQPWIFDQDGNLTLPGNTFAVNYANGTQVPLGGGSANTGNVTFDDINIIGDGNLHLQPDPANSGSYLDIFLTSGPDLHLVASAAANLILGKDNQSNVMTSWDGNVYIQSWDVGTNTQGGVWTFGGDGVLQVPSNATAAGPGTIASANGYPTLLAYGNSGGFSIHGGPELDWMNANDPANNFSNNTVLRNTMFINGNGLYVGMNENGVANVPTAVWRFTPDGTTIFPTLTTQRGDNPSGTITGQTLLFGDATQEAIISTPDGIDAFPNSQRLVINPGQGYGPYEGGDIYLWAGRGGDGSGSGGDIKIRGGQGGANTSGGNGGDGGYIRMEAGDAQVNGVAGYIDITGGQGGAGQGGGYVHITGGQGATVGGDVKIYGGYGTATGGNVNIWGGASGNGQINEGNVNIETGGNTWTFDPSGNLTLPAGGSIYSEGFTPSGNPGNTITLQPAGSGITTNQKLLIYPTAGDGDHIHLTSGNLYQTELFLGSDNLFVKLANTGNIVINSDDNAGNTAQWKFGIDGNLTLPGNLVINGLTNVFGSNVALLQSNPDLPLLSVSSGSNGGASSIWAEDIGNIGTSNIAAVYTNPTPGSGIVRIAVGQNGGAGGPNLWDFNANGTTTIPGGLIGSGASPAPYISGFDSISSITLSASGNITGGNIIGNGNTLSNVATKTTGSWTLASGVNTVNINVPLNGTYAIWINGNIPNGIITYTATAVITNTNVPVLGSQYAWYYSVGNALVFTSIPDQFTGTVGSISTVNTYAGNTANVFTFGITNNSGANAVVNYGYTKL